MSIELLKTAVNDHVCVAFNYDNLPRTVEVHAVGLNAKGDVIFRGYQVAGDTSSGKLGWKLFTLDKADNVNLVSILSRAPREGYVKGDRAMRTILAEV